MILFDLSFEETDELVVCSKQGTMPVHPCGGYSQQSLMNVLEKHYKEKSMEDEKKINKLYTIHRLDRLTSGLVIIGKSSAIAQSYSKCIMNRSCQKIYLARVAGKFPLRYKNLNVLTSERIEQSGIPMLGEWQRGISVNENEGKSESNTSLDDKTSLEASRLRKQHAVASWIADQNDKPLVNDKEDNNTTLLERVFENRHRYVHFCLRVCNLYFSRYNCCSHFLHCFVRIFPA